MLTMRRLIPDAHLVVCHNGERDPIPWPADEIIDQRTINFNLPYDPSGPGWKLYPPRLNIDAWELWLDNDLILYEMPPAIEEFFQSDRLLISEAFKRSYSERFDSLVPQGVNYNSGILGLPPGFDFEAHLTPLMQDRVGWTDHFDEQSLVAHIFHKHDPLIVPMKEVQVLQERYIKGSHGIHFVGLNGGDVKHWNRYKSERLF